MPVKDGDLLFRYLIPSQFEKKGPLLSKERFTRKVLRDIIDLQKQDIQNRDIWKTDKYIKHLEENLGDDDLKRLGLELDEEKKNEAKIVQENMQLVGHVGIADVEEKQVLEIGKGGFNAETIKGRKHYDIVVRFPSKGKEIKTMARRVYNKNRTFRYSGRFVDYPLGQLKEILKSPADPSLLANPKWMVELAMSDFDAKQRGPDIMKSEVVCSHLTHAILYAVFQPGGTVATATKKEYYKIFRVSPSNLLRFIRYGLGIFQNAPQAEIVGVQHGGNLSKDLVRLVDILKKGGKIKDLKYDDLQEISYI